MAELAAKHRLQMPGGVSLRHLAVVIVVLALLSPTPVQAFAVCRNTFRCKNGGEEKFGQSIFGPCRCFCPDGFTGPRCQYREVTRKRSISMLADLLQQGLRTQDTRQVMGQDYGYDTDLEQLQQQQELMQRQQRQLSSHPRFFFR